MFVAMVDLVSSGYRSKSTFFDKNSSKMWGILG
jgi:hypothetical protein